MRFLWCGYQSHPPVGLRFTYLQFNLVICDCERCRLIVNELVEAQLKLVRIPAPGSVSIGAERQR